MILQAFTQPKHSLYVYIYIYSWQVHSREGPEVGALFQMCFQPDVLAKLEMDLACCFQICTQQFRIHRFSEVKRTRQNYSLPSLMTVFIYTYTHSMWRIAVLLTKKVAPRNRFKQLWTSWRAQRGPEDGGAGTRPLHI